ncbi:glycosyltransferase family 4 protein [Nocardioides sp. KIGAM211]|uniref:Glycosyltransferase family 4 protein n=1 Tax=Nocardioides luti TaxID=2761101 RepID=A0A7X0RK17_9ACTN|nr:glycosyltransferase family 4 protein [Nocardioides luti]MBB6629751.1 glycosyltransferase family 4 protein [Nocardioides luti]
MRILHVTDCYLPRIGGIEMHVRDLCRAQRDAGHDALVVTATAAGPNAESDDPWVHRLRPDARLLLSSATGGDGLAGLLDQYRPDVVHAHVSVFSPFTVGAARQAAAAGLPTLVTVHSMWQGPVRRVMRALLLGLSREPVAWSAVSRSAAEPVRAVLADRVPVLVLPNAVDPGWWRSEPAPVPAVPTIVSVMRLARRKRPLALARMLRKVRATLPADLPLRAVIVGDGPQRPALEAYLARHATSWVEVRGRLDREQIRSLYAESTVYAAPATLESFGIAALEARSAGLPVVASTRGGVGEFVTDGVDGLLAHDDDDMVAALVRLVGDATLLASITAHNRAEVPRLDWPAACTASLAAYAVAARRAGTEAVGSTLAQAVAGQRS